MKQIHTDQQTALRALLRATRVAEKLTQQELAARLKAPQSLVSKYESGERRLDVLELRQVCAALGVTTVEFMRRLEKKLK